MSPECKREWTRKFMATNFTKVFMAKKYKSHRETIIAEQQIALFPATQPEIIRIRELERIQKEIDEFNEEIRKLVELRNLKHNQLRHVRIHIEPAQRERREFVRHCPSSECKGFLSSQWKCGICHIWCCPSCHEIKGLDKNTEHTCDPNVVESVREIGSTSKNCPKCHVPIFRIEGCNQMWCTMCEVYFNWRTGEIDTSGRYHNPHAMEAMRRRNLERVAREPGDIICGREINYQTFRIIDTRLKYLYALRPSCLKIKEHIERISKSISQNALHIRHFIMPSYRVNIEDKNLRLRIDYMMNLITLDEFKFKLQCIHKKSMKSHEIYQVFDMFMVSLTDIIYRFIDDLNNMSRNSEFSNTILDEIGSICQFANECFQDIQIAYGGVVPYIIETTLKVTKYEIPRSIATPDPPVRSSISGGGGKSPTESDGLA
jgi:hypothetical protein